MLRKLVLLLTGVMSFAFVSAEAQDMKTVFLSMPDSVMPLLSKDNRADFVDFLANKMQAKVKNAYDEYSYMDTLTADYAFIRLTPSSNVTLKLLPVTDTTKVVCMIHTYRADASDSKITFYDTTWHRRDTSSFLSMPGTEDFLSGSSVKDEDSLRLAKSKLDATMLVASFTPSGTDLQFTFDDAYLPVEDKALVKACICPMIVKKWEKGKFISK